MRLIIVILGKWYLEQMGMEFDMNDYILLGILELYALVWDILK